MKILCDRCKREFNVSDKRAEEVSQQIMKNVEVICPDCQEDANI
jgi:DNA-directed RNA polymerase subunit RPC12/RpoP